MNWQTFKKAALMHPLKTNVGWIASPIKERKNLQEK